MATANAKKTTTEDLAKQIETLKGDLVDLTEMMGKVGKNKGQQIAQSARETGEAQLAKVQHGAERAVHKADDFVNEKPAMALGIAAGIGFLVGMTASRR
ncbi:hypothetical protein GCM10008927_06070 [Amylibacter ulvae]|uniref:DUF883 domain-containing protein n=1 Tax=Paramylibacter ulvae TaxID=1651968 RepID=A0ABQ3CU81_9RHOB|nr:DUF883 family protein [Amylibacter ulvae]GHA44081.1 hypothetical protein GCM10008927_06070 [Amylibacter ulvae]